ncbi:hypothetical protein K450DRAFT_220325 [Umbelopsis ramanniana AG]|uniref:Protein BIG1 n=1 Tax=Umbelopsis ramanniana AG TaxID=1314678 RepID=A0AAD5HGS2_UMBRA|nr:uncharacterized protein K450DRAFT_220325 [Umbelopsis ramanniana AG]KAI8583862.1 hypothetical protein K450DRAFT_220325 [Umbelopsis ramanniana AG]
MKLLTALLPIALVSAVSAFENTVPCLAWSPKRFTSVVEGSHDQYVVLQKDAIDTILTPFGSELCQTKVVAIVDQPEIHTSDFAQYSDALESIKKHSSEAATRIQHQYIDKHVDIDQLVGRIAQLCGSTLAIVNPQGISKDEIYNGNGNTVALLELPSAHSEMSLAKNDALVDDLIKAIEENVGDDYAVILTSSAAKAPLHSKRSTFEKRAPNNVNAPIFQKYQLFNTGVFMAIAVVAMFIGIVVIGISWLGSIQTPARFDSKPKRS